MAWLLLATVVVWSVAFDTIYAMVDRDDDVYIGIKSTAVLLGDMDRAFVAAMQIATLALLAVVGALEGFGGWYALGLVGAAATCVWQHHLIRDRDPTACFRAFLNNNWFGASVFAGVVAEYVAA